MQPSRLTATAMWASLQLLTLTLSYKLDCYHGLCEWCLMSEVTVFSWGICVTPVACCTLCVWAFYFLNDTSVKVTCTGALSEGWSVLFRAFPPLLINGENAQRDSRTVKEMHLRNDITTTSRGKKTKECELQEQPGSRSGQRSYIQMFHSWRALLCPAQCAVLTQAPTLFLGSLENGQAVLFVIHRKCIKIKVCTKGNTQSPSGH